MRRPPALAAAADPGPLSGRCGKKRPGNRPLHGLGPIDSGRARHRRRAKGRVRNQRFTGAGRIFTRARCAGVGPVYPEHGCIQGTQALTEALDRDDSARARAAGDLRAGVVHQAGPDTTLCHRQHLAHGVRWDWRLRTLHGLHGAPGGRLNILPLRLRNRLPALVPVRRLHWDIPARRSR